MKVFVIDLARCNGCYACQFVCKDEHVANDWTPYAKPQPDTGQFWLKLHEEVRGTVPKVKVDYRPRLCMHCEDAPCIEHCPIEGAIYRRDDGLVIIDPEKCTGCRECIDRCPYDAIFYNENLYIAQKCTGCAHLLDDGWEVPRCVDACPTECLKFGEESDFADEIAKAEVVNPEWGHKPRVYYLNVMKRFVGGTVYDPEENEVIIGATCTLADNKNGKSYTATTDEFGDFWFRDLDEDASFNLTITSNGKKKVFENISTEKDVNLGDIPLV